MPGADVASKACEESLGRGGDSFSVCLTPCAASLPLPSHTLSCLPSSPPASLLSFSLVPTGVKQETRLDFVVVCDQTLVDVVLVAMIVVEELVVGE